MDIKNINLNNFDFIAPSKIETIVSNETMRFIDIEVENDNTFFFKLNDNNFLLSHNCDGSHLTSMFLGWFKRFGENLFHEKKICKLNLPLVLLTDKNEKVIHHFFNLVDFNTWEKQNPNHKYHVEYWKGLGSISKKLLEQLINKYGFDYFIDTYKLDKDGEVYLDHWLSDQTSDKRKEYLKQYQLDINNI